ncbi:glycosyltransferase family 2 protein [Pseudohongiella acticola]|jgi:glycosyl transferase family 2|uniref:glycosyltransferase family 2 protein n=1 Tax=Pseudohongiella acticola TaxID=1524254 RepID=UPI0030EF415F
MLNRIRTYLTGRHRTPKLSVVIVFYRMPRQALNTLYTLSTDFQQHVSADDYEIIAVENRSDANIDNEALKQIRGPIRYFLRDENLPTPVHAVNFGVAQARGEQLCLMVDGARMVTPGLVHHLLLANRLYDSAVVSVPGYHLGDELQQKAVLNGYNEEQEQQLLASVNWRDDGYRLLDIACLSGTSRSGFFRPLGESNSLGITRQMFDQLGGFDTGFTESGGGQCNLDFYKRALELEKSRHVFLPGEGSFHQYHGGATTSGSEERDAMMQRHFDQYHALRGEYYSPAQKEPVYLGALHPSVMRFVHHSAKRRRAMEGELIENYSEQAAKRVMHPKRFPDVPPEESLPREC